MKHKTASEFQT